MRACFINSYPMSSHGERVEGSFWDLLYKDTNPKILILRVLPSWPSHSPKPHILTPSHWVLGFRHKNLGGGRRRHKHSVYSTDWCSNESMCCAWKTSFFWWRKVYLPRQSGLSSTNSKTSTTAVGRVFHTMIHSRQMDNWKMQMMCWLFLMTHVENQMTKRKIHK